MQFKAFIIAAVASVAVAQTMTTSSYRSTSTACAAQNILDACKGTIQGQINACSMSDYSCLCTQYENMLTCYNNCPNDPTVGTVQAQREQNCINASVYGSSTSTVVRVSATSSTASATGSNSSTTTTGSRTATAASTSETSNGAQGKTVGGVVALVAAGVVAML